MSTYAGTYAVNRLVQELFRQPGLLQRFRERRSEVYDEYQLDAVQRAGLDEGSPAALTAAGVHPILQMHYLLASNPDVARLITVDAYRDDSDNTPDTHANHPTHAKDQ